MDLKKEIKLSDLLPKRKPSGGSPKKLSAKPARAVKARKARKQEIVGLKIGASQLAAAQVVNNGGATLVRVAREPLEPGIVIGGEVRDAAKLGAALDEFFTRNDLPRKGVRLGIGTNRVGVRVLDVEGIDDERQLGNAVMFRAHEAMAIPLDQAVLDYRVVGERRDDSGGVTRRVVLAAAYREPIDHFVNACRSANVELAGIDVEAFALLRAVERDHTDGEDGKPTARVALAIGHDRSVLAVSDGSVCDFTRVLEWGGSRLETAIGRELGLSQDDATAIKLTMSLVGQPGESRDARVQDAARRELTTLSRELVASLQFYRSQFESLPIEEILITGGTARLPGLAEELAKLVHMKVRIANPLASVDAPPSVSERDDLASLTVAIGLGVEA